MHTFTIGAIVRHFKREYITDPQSAEYLYKILAFASHTETGEKLVIYQALFILHTKRVRVHMTCL